MQLLLAPQNWPFAAAIGLGVLLCFLQVALLLLGGATDFFEVDADLDADVEPDAGLDGILDWLHVGQIPVSILLTLAGFSFGMSGLVVQSIASSLTGKMLATGPAAAIALVAAVPALHLVGSLVKRILPRDETEAVSVESFLGCEATITVGTARRGRPAEARLRDKWGKTHYILVEPESEGQEFAAGTQVLILTRHEHIFRAADHSLVQTAMDQIDAEPLPRRERRPGAAGELEQ